MDISSLYEIFKKSCGVSTDTRSIVKGQIFFALKGENFDGNDYVSDALKAGASCCVVNSGSSASKINDDRIIVTEDTVKTLSNLSSHHRINVKKDRLPVIAVTGTNGKTTTKELMNIVLSSSYRVTATDGNLNNDIGVPLSLLKIKEDTDIAIIEMGANHPSDIKKLCEVAMPDYGIITNVGKAHLQGFGSVEGVEKAKGYLYDYLAAHGGKAFYNESDERLSRMIEWRKLSSTSYGLKSWHVKIENSSAESPFLTFDFRHETLAGKVETNLIGDYNAINVIAALAVGEYFGADMNKAIQNIGRWHPANNRSQLLKTEFNRLIVDAYNANPSSMNAAIDNFVKINSRNKILLLGSMGELGESSVEEHCALLTKLSYFNDLKVFLVGGEFRKALEKTGFKYCWFPDSLSLSVYLKENRIKNSVILIKGSRSASMEKVIQSL